jgi:hypothetical protein
MVNGRVLIVAEGYKAGFDRVGAEDSSMERRRGHAHQEKTFPYRASTFVVCGACA